MEYNLETRFIKGDAISPDMIQVLFDAKLAEELFRDFSGLASRVADKIAEEIYPEMEQKILSDPLFKDRIISEVLIRISNRLADKGLTDNK